MCGTGIDSEVEIYAMKQSNEHRYMELKKEGGGGYINRAYRKLNLRDKMFGTIFYLNVSVLNENLSVT
jgi:hypothetical protein